MAKPSASQHRPEPFMYRLGLDVGAASIGWAIVALDSKGSPLSVPRAGVHLFEAGVNAGKSDIETAMMQGKEQSKAIPRRLARSMRRQRWRRRRRKRKLLNTLVSANLLPHGDFSTGDAIMGYLADLDRSLLESGQFATGTHTDQQTRYYSLRAQAVVEPVSRFALGRAIYHLAQRRGFLSNRKTPEREGESLSDMKSKIGELAECVKAHAIPTLGAYFASLDPDEQRIRGRWTSRQMYLDEFEQIWKTQSAHHNLTDDQYQAIHSAIFHQRPLRDQSHLVGRCSLTGYKRCAIAERIAQRFRVLQQVNHLRIVMDDSSERPLTSDERSTLFEILLLEGDLSVAKARQRLSLPRGVIFSIERGGEKKLIGHRTDAKIRAIVGSPLWDQMDESRRDELVHNIRSIREIDTLRRVAQSRYSLTREQATELAAVTLEDGHAAHSRRAIEALVSRMEHDGLSYAEARRDEYPESFTSEQPKDLLPPVGDWNSDLRSPSVARALTELRKLVNAIIRQWGKPDQIHLELARDLKASRGRREKVTRQMRDREKNREQVAATIVESLGIASPTWEK